LHGSNQELPWNEARFEANSIHGQNLEIVASSSTIIYQVVFGEVQENLCVHLLHKDPMEHRILHHAAC
jgi:hypothetical protein